MVVAVEVTVSVAVPAVVPLIVTGEVTVQVGTLVPVVGVTAQVSATAPVNPPDGVTVMFEVPEPPAAGSVTEPLLLSVIAGVVETAPDTTTGTEVVYTRLPEVPVMVTT